MCTGGLLQQQDTISPPIYGNKRCFSESEHSNWKKQQDRLHLLNVLSNKMKPLYYWLN